MIKRILSLFKDNPENSFDADEVTRLLNRIIDICLLAFGIFALPLVLISLNEARETGFTIDKLVQVIAILIAFSLLILRKKISLKIKSLIVLLGIIIAAFVNMASMGVISDGPLLLFFAVGLIATTFDLKLGFTSLILFSLGYFLVGFLFVSGNLHNDIDLNENQIQYSGWISDVLVFFLLGAILIIAISKGKSKFLQFIEKIFNTNRELSISRDNSLAAQKAKNEFLDNIGHEVRTPLNHIGGYVELLKPVLKDDLSKSYLERISLSSEKLLYMINTIIDLSDLEKGNFETNFDYFNFHQFIYQISAVYKEQAEKKNLEFSISVPEDLDMDIYLDKARLSIALGPLMENAVKFTKEGSISIVVEKMKSSSFDLVDLLIRINDTGIGLDPDFIESSTDYFTQQDGSTSRAYEGMGIGLALSKKVIEKLGGVIEIDSVVNKGTSIIISLSEVKTTLDDPLKDKSGSFRHLLNYSKPVLPEEIRILLLDEANNMWVELNTRQPIDQVKIFGKLLKEEGERYGVNEVAEYGSRILKATESFDIDKILSLLKLYPQLLVSLNLK